MQSKLANKNAPRGALLGLAAATLLLAGAHSVLGQGASPVGFWDCVQTGARGGLATMRFETDGTNGSISGNEIIVPNQPRGSTSDLGRGGQNTTRTGNNGGTNSPPLPAHTDIFGAERFPTIDRTNLFNNTFEVVTTNLDASVTTNGPFNFVTTNIVFDGIPAGQWGFNTDGKLIGFLTEVGHSTFITNVVLSFTNVQGPFTTTVFTANITETNGVTSTNLSAEAVQFYVTNMVYTTNVTADRLTNAISFTGKAVPGQRLTLNLQTPAGTVIFRGLPPTPLASVAGSWYGRKKNQGLTFYEFFDLIPDPDPNTLNTYILFGSGPGYALGTYIFDGKAYGGGEMIVSRQKRFAIAANVFSLGEMPTSPYVVRAVTGPFNIGRQTFSGAKGVQGINPSDNLRFSYNGSKKP